MDKRMKPTHAPTGIELTLVAKYSSVFVMADDILRAASEGRWAPATTEWLDVVRQGGADRRHVFGVGDVKGFRDALQLFQKENSPPPARPRPPGSLRRVNLFAHGDSTGISLSGHVSEPVAKESRFAIVTMGDGLKTITLDTIDAMENQSENQQAASRRLFAKGGTIFIYSCKAGVRSDILKEIADYFQVRVASFRGKIAFCPVGSARDVPKGMRRGASGLYFRLGEETCQEGMFDFHNLKPSVEVLPEPPPPPPAAHRKK